MVKFCEECYSMIESPRIQHFCNECLKNSGINIYKKREY